MSVAVPERAAATRAAARPRVVNARVISRTDAPRARARQPRPLPPPRQRAPRQRPQRVQVSMPRREQPLTNYQGALMAEFVAAVVLIATGPIATRTITSPAKGQVSPSPYQGGDVLQLAAVTLAYLLLALLGMTSRGASRFAAWFGLLILVTVGLGQAAHIAKILDLFGAGNAAVEAGGQPILGSGQGAIESAPQPLFPGNLGGIPTP